MKRNKKLEIIETYLNEMDEEEINHVHADTILRLLDGEILDINFKDIDKLIDAFMTKYKVNPSIIVIPSYIYTKRDIMEKLAVNDYKYRGLLVIGSKAVDKAKQKILIF